MYGNKLSYKFSSLQSMHEKKIYLLSYMQEW